MIIPIFLTGLGCAKEGACTFCDQEIATSKGSVTTDAEVKRRVEDSFKECLSGVDMEEVKYPLEVAFYGASFTALDFGYQKELMKLVQETFERYTGKPNKDNLKIRISTRPDRIKKEELLDLKIRFNLHLVEIGVQSMNDDVLCLAKRGHTRQDIMKASREIVKLGLDLSCHQMIGLPGSNAGSDIETAVEVARLKPRYVRIHPTLVLKGTELETIYREGKYTPLTIEQAVDITEKVVRVYREAGIGIIRIGLHPSELLTRNIVAGPWHPSFRELVEGRYLMREASSQLTAYEGRRVQMKISPLDETYIRGENNINYQTLMDLHKLEDIVIVKDPDTQRGSVVITNLDIG
jgi:histone acetyltransferase (RNA polymerase elongator complex component)